MSSTLISSAASVSLHNVSGRDQVEVAARRALSRLYSCTGEEPSKVSTCLPSLSNAGGVPRRRPFELWLDNNGDENTNAPRTA